MEGTEESALVSLGRRKGQHAFHLLQSLDDSFIGAHTRQLGERPLAALFACHHADGVSPTEILLLTSVGLEFDC